jgi:hypothetical protein
MNLYQLSLFILFLFQTFNLNARESEFLTFLQSQASIQDIKTIEGGDYFRKSYELRFRQPVDHADTTAGFFTQRVYVSHLSKEAPVVLITEGYTAAQASRANYTSELSQLLEANQIDVEHRYFGESWPSVPDWQYLTVANAAADHHRITELFKKFYTGKWIHTGISKGGQTAISHRTLYPDDVDATVAYVGPVNFGMEDGRHEPFIEKVPGTPEERKKVRAMQLEVLKRRETLFPMFQELVQSKDYTFRIPLEEVYDYCVLEYSFILWQFGSGPVDSLDTSAPDSVLFHHFFTTSSPDYFSIEGSESTRSFFVQAAHELGYYGYDTRPFKEYLKIKNARNYLSKIFLPEGLKIPYNKKTMREVQNFLDTTNKKMLFIYGAYDPWTATGVCIPDKPNLLKIVKPGGNHRTRINNLPESLKEQATEMLYEWLGVETKALN